MSTDFFVAGGTLRSDSPSYVERQADSDLFQFALAGHLCYVLTTRQMGKSSLMTRVAHRLRQHSCERAPVHSAIIDLTAIGTATIDEWYVSLLDDMQWQLNFETDVETWWFDHATLSPIRRFSKFVREVLQTELDGNLVLFIDEVDSALKLPFSDDFFAAIRALFNTGALESAETINRATLSIILLGVADPNDLIKDAQRTPFNVGTRIRLEELQQEDALPVLSAGLGDVPAEVLERIFYWTDGHPYLTQKLALAVTQDSVRGWNSAEIDGLAHTLFMSARSEDSNIKFAAGRMTSSPNRNGLLKLYRQVLQGNEIVNDEASELQSELKLYGLVKSDSQDKLVLRNRLYATIFNDAWVKALLPQQRPIALVGALLLFALVIGLVGWNLRQQQQSQTELIALNRAQFGEMPSIAALYRIITLGDVATARGLFDQLTLNEQIALFDAAGPDMLEAASGVSMALYEGLATDNLDQPAANTALLQAMVRSLRRGDSAENSALAIEIDSWLRARVNALSGNYEQARIEYSVAIALNGDNPATRYERALTNLGLDAFAAAGDDFSRLYEVAGWQGAVAREVANSAALQSWLSNNRHDYRQLLSLVPTATTASVAAVPSATPSPDATAIPTATAHPSPEASDKPTATPEPTAVIAEISDTPLVWEAADPFGTIVYTCYIGGVDQICTIAPDGNNIQQHTTSDTTDWYGSISAEGDILFSSRRSISFGIYALLDQGQQLVTTPRNGDYAPERSPDRSQIVFTRVDEGGQNIWLMGSDGSNPRPLTDLTGDAVDPTWSPDGEQIVFAFRAAGEAAYIHHIYEVESDTLRVLHTALDNVGGRSDWSPSGEQIVFYAGERGNRHIYAISADGSELRQLTNQSDNLAPAWSPDGNWIVFTSYRDGDNELYIMRPDGSDVRQLTVNNSADWQPRWGGTYKE